MLVLRHYKSVTFYEKKKILMNSSVINFYKSFRCKRFESLELKLRSNGEWFYSRLTSTLSTEKFKRVKRSLLQFNNLWAEIFAKLLPALLIDFSNDTYKKKNHPKKVTKIRERRQIYDSHYTPRVKCNESKYGAE